MAPRLISARYALSDPARTPERQNARTAQLLRQLLPAADACSLWHGAWQLGTTHQLSVKPNYYPPESSTAAAASSRQHPTLDPLVLGSFRGVHRLRRISIATKPRQLHQHRRNPSTFTSAHFGRSTTLGYCCAHCCHCAVKNQQPLAIFNPFLAAHLRGRGRTLRSRTPARPGVRPQPQIIECVSRV
jgi:hypothetical protein